MTNHNPETGIAYGYISANELDQDLVQELLYGRQARDLSYEEAQIAWAELDGYNAPEEFEYECEEPIITGTYEGVTYCTSWLGGALHFFIYQSPIIEKGRPCSPCVPLALDLGSVGKGNYEGYGVPQGWRAAV